MTNFLLFNFFEVLRVFFQLDIMLIVRFHNNNKKMSTYEIVSEKHHMMTPKYVQKKSNCQNQRYWHKLVRAVYKIHIHANSQTKIINYKDGPDNKNVVCTLNIENVIDLNFIMDEIEGICNCAVDAIVEMNQSGIVIMMPLYVFDTPTNNGKKRMNENFDRKLGQKNGYASESLTDSLWDDLIDDSDNKSIYQVISSSMKLTPHEYVNYKLSVTKHDNESVCKIKFASKFIDCNPIRFISQKFKRVKRVRMNPKEMTITFFIERNKNIELNKIKKKKKKNKRKNKNEGNLKYRKNRKRKRVSRENDYDYDGDEQYEYDKRRKKRKTRN